MVAAKRQIQIQRQRDRRFGHRTTVLGYGCYLSLHLFGGLHARGDRAHELDVCSHEHQDAHSETSLDIGNCTRGKVRLRHWRVQTLVQTLVQTSECPPLAHAMLYCSSSFWQVASSRSQQSRARCRVVLVRVRTSVVSGPRD